VRFKGRTMTATPREVTGAERDRYFEVMKQTWPNFSLYEKRTDRTIPVFVLTPR
jgi:deazaflavin-dependent oxidoreductase (nitroreductase family)